MEITFCANVRAFVYGTCLVRIWRAHVWPCQYVCFCMRVCAHVFACVCVCVCGNGGGESEQCHIEVTGKTRKALWGWYGETTEI